MYVNQKKVLASYQIKQLEPKKLFWFLFLLETVKALAQKGRAADHFLYTQVIIGVYLISLFLSFTGLFEWGNIISLWNLSLDGQQDFIIEPESANLSYCRLIFIFVSEFFLGGRTSKYQIIWRNGSNQTSFSVHTTTQCCYNIVCLSTEKTTHRDYSFGYNGQNSKLKMTFLKFHEHAQLLLVLSIITHTKCKRCFSYITFKLAFYAVNRATFCI